MSLSSSLTLLSPLVPSCPLLSTLVPSCPHRKQGDIGDWEMYQYKTEPKSLWFNSVTNTLTETPPQEVREPIIVYTLSSPFI